MNDPFGEHPVPPQGMEPPPELFATPRRRFRFGPCFVEGCEETAIFTVGLRGTLVPLGACEDHVSELLEATGHPK